MLKVGQNVAHNCHCNCCEPKTTIKQQHSCACGCCSQPREDTFEKEPISKVSLKKALPVGAVAGLASAGLVMLGNELLNKVFKSNRGLATTVAVGVGIGVANGVINATLTNQALKREQQKEIIA